MGGDQAVTRAGAGFSMPMPIAEERREAAESYLLKLIPPCAIFYVIVVVPLLRLAFPDEDPLNTSRIEHRIFWTTLAFITLTLSYRSLRHRISIRIPSAIYWLIGYLLLAGASVIWSSVQTATVIRYVQQLFVVTVVVLPCLISRHREEILPSFLGCFATAILLNVVALGIRPPTPIGHPGIYDHKNILGGVAGLALIFGLAGMVERGHLRRFVSLCTAVGALACLLASQSKTALAVACAAPFIAFVTLRLSCMTRIPAGLIAAYGLIVSCLVIFILASAFSWTLDDVLTLLFGDPTFTKRTDIWIFVSTMIQKRPVLGWGYQAFWLSGPDAPSLTEGAGWVAKMPHAHNAYLDVILDIGYFGFAIAIGFLVSVAGGIHATARKAPRAAWLPLSLFLFGLAHDLLETSFFRGFDDAWIVLLTIAGSLPVIIRPSRYGRAGLTLGTRAASTTVS
jgi:exopolysaccharide production protein ExoQ